ncbi:MAG: hypothetical protein ABI648_14550 [Betaproteobacteria bacterium]
MTIRKITGTAAALLGALLLNANAFSVEPAAHQHPAGTHQLTLDAGKKWATDQPLRKGMETIRNAVAAETKAIHAGKQTDAGYDALAGKVDAQVGYIVQNCKLKPEADAQLHVLIGEIMQGVDIMRGKDPLAKRAQGAEKIVTAFNTYPKYFDHPGWKPLH